jgi:hypothetical protein
VGEGYPTALRRFRKGAFDTKGLESGRVMIDHGGLEKALVGKGTKHDGFSL